MTAYSAPNTPAKAGFSLLEKQSPPFTKVQPDLPVQSRLANYYECGLPIGGHRQALSEAERHRLVEAAKSPTPFKASKTSANLARKALDHRANLKALNEQRFEIDLNYAHDPEQREALHRLLDSEQRAKLKKLPIGKVEQRDPEGTDHQAWTVITHRAWSDEYRIRTHVEQPNSLPPEQNGIRISHNLSEAGAKKIADSCAFMHLKQGGYRTFLTLTFDEAGRSRVDIREADGWFTELDHNLRAKGLDVPENKLMDTTPDGDYCPLWEIGGRLYSEPTGSAGDDVTFSTIQKEISRFLDGANQMRKRGWKAEKVCNFVDEKTKAVIPTKVTCYGKNGEAIKGDPSPYFALKGFLADKKIKLQRLPIRYTWVVENPLNERGQRNPHVHILMDWRVKYSEFPSWADRLESLWGQGFGHIEKIKDSESAGGYLAKAAGYMSKAAGADDQGPVRGNRYGISKDARAPEWCCIGRYPIHIMGHLIKDVHDYYTHTFSQQFKARRELGDKTTELAKQLKASTSDIERKVIKRQRSKIGQALTKVRETIKALPAIASKHQIILKSERAFFEFMKWAQSPYYYGDLYDYLPTKDPIEVWDNKGERPKGMWLKQFQLTLHARKAARRWLDLPLTLYENEPEQEQRKSYWRDWFEYEGLTA